MTKQEIIDFIREAIELKNKTEGVLTTTIFGFHFLKKTKK